MSGQLTTKVCGKCRTEQPLENFSPMAGGVGGRYSRCKPCVNEHMRNLPAKEKRRRFLKTMHKMTPEEFTERLAVQGSVCAACGAEEPGGKYHVWHIDHDHECCPGKKSCGRCVRGLLCHCCNLGIGYFGDDPNKMRSAIRYLESVRTTSELGGNG